MPLSASPGSQSILSALRYFLTSRSPTSLYLGGDNPLSTSASKFSLNSKCLTRVLLRKLASFVYSVKSKLVLIMWGLNFHVICIVFQICTGSEFVAFWVLYSVLSCSLTEKAWLAGWMWSEFLLSSAQEERGNGSLYAAPTSSLVSQNSTLWPIHTHRRVGLKNRKEKPKHGTLNETKILL